MTGNTSSFRWAIRSSRAVELRANALGKQGWELAAIDAGVWIFKRSPIDEGETNALEAIIEETVPVQEALSLGGLTVSDVTAVKG